MPGCSEFSGTKREFLDRTTPCAAVEYESVDCELDDTLLKWVTIDPREAERRLKKAGRLIRDFPTD